MQLYLALVLAAAVLACLVLLVSWRSREEEAPLPAGVLGSAVPAAPSRVEKAAQVPSLPPDLPRRRVTARQRIPADDPILSAMGLGSETPAPAPPAAKRAPRRPRAGKPSSGPGQDGGPGEKQD